jgi:hypothetical protein
MKSTTRRFIVIGVFLLLSWLVFSPVASAQTPAPPPTRESLTKEIQLRAQKDVEMGAAPQSPSDLAVLFSNQAAAVGMTMSEVKNIYDEAYQAATPAKSPWDDLSKPQGGWIFLIIGGLLVILANIAKDYLTAFGKKLAEHAYQRLARFRPFWMIALRRYRQSLEATYRELKIPFRAGRPLQMQDVYVPVRVDGGDKKQVDAYQTIQNQKRLVVLGDPGSGKTMFLRHVAFTYARQGLDDFDGQPIPVYLELNRVESAGGDLLAALTKTLENHNFPGAEGFLKSALENHALLILLDGLDEVNAAARPVLVKQIQDLDQKHAENRIIVTCRKAVYQGELDAWVDGKLEIIEFSDQQIQRFMTSWQKDMPAEKSIEHFFRTLQERPQIMALARNPLLLTMVAYLYVDTEFALPHSRSEFYSRSTDLLLDQWKLERNRYKATHKRIVLQRLALFNQSQAGKTGERRTLELADVLKEIRAVLPDLMLKTEDVQPLLDEIVQRSGLMLVLDGGTRYQFTHLTLQEYFAARALESDQKGLLDFYRATPDAWREVVRLWCALEHDSTAMLKELYALHPVMAFECLSDAQQVDNAYADELIESFKPRLHEALTNDLLVSAFAMLAADPRPRGKKWFEFIKSNLDIKQNRLAACAVLALTNIPQAAGPLVKLAATDSGVIPFLVQLGNLAVPALTESAQKGEIWAMDALVDIGTPQAALALQPLLWIDEPKAYHAAWRLAALLPLAGVENALQTVTLTYEQRKAKQIEWVWEPFSANTELQSISGRIAFLLNTPAASSFKTKLSCDSRLALVSCAVIGNSYLKKYDESTKQKIRDLISQKDALSADEEKKASITQELSSKLCNNENWLNMYYKLSSDVQILILGLLDFDVLPSEEDWRNVFKPVRYEFSDSWHVKALKLLTFFLVSFIAWGTWWQIAHSATLLTWTNIAGVISVILLGSIAFAQREEWETDNLESLVIFEISGLGGAFAIVMGGLTHSWIASVVSGILLVAVCSIVIFSNRSTHIRLYITLGIALVNTLIGALFGGQGNIFNSVIVGGLLGAFVGMILGMLLEDFSNALIIALSSPVSIGLNLIFIYHITVSLYDVFGFIVSILCWVIWLSGFMLLYFLGKHQERRAQNPLHGLLEASPSTNLVTNKRMTMGARLFRWRGL